jgi:phenylalanyl-tRNA synthetase beta chain
MLVSFEWLKELVSTDSTPAQVADMLTMGGVEVEAVEDTRPDFEKVVVGHLRKVSSHPNADKLVLCEVDVGDPSPLGIVCGATNMNEGDKVPVALVGATLAGDLKVKKSKIRGETSMGMMCSERELGLGDDHEGIMILPPETDVGAPFDEAMGLNDVVLELGITPNRPDCLSMIGVAREVAAMAGMTARQPEFDVPEEGSDIASQTSVTIDDSGGCPRYAARIVEGVTIGPSPLWMQQKLMKAGLRPLNNVVDVTNFVLIELGHPLHAFDYDKLEENRIVVRRAQNGELIETLDGVKRELLEQMLVIADAKDAVAIAGVMGGAASEVTEQTTTILIESAYFDPVSIRRTAKSLGLSTEASYRFERGADPEMALTALDRAASLMAELAGGKIAKGRVDEYPRKIECPTIRLRYERTNKILGIEVPQNEIASILSSLGFGIVSEGNEAIDVRVPSFRPDVTAEIDLIEEVARVYGYGEIASTYPQDNTVVSRGQQPPSVEETCGKVLTASGFSEIITYSFGAPSKMADFAEREDDVRAQPIKMKNPLTEDASVLRTTVIPGVLASIGTNVNAGNKNLKIFETGTIYLPAPGDVLPDEKMYVCAAITGLSRGVDWKGKPANVDFFDLKGVAENMIESMGLEEMKTVKAVHEGFHPGICADIMVGSEVVGKIGELHPAILDRYAIDQAVFLFEVDLDAAMIGPKAGGNYENFSRYPHAERDLAVVVDEDVEAAAISTAILESGGDILRDVILFDVYKGKQVGDGKKSLAFGLRFQSNERTLTDEEITARSDKIVVTLKERFDAKLRA